MTLSYDPEKRRKTLEERGLDFEDARKAFAAQHFTRIDDRFDYGEQRFVSLGVIDAVVVAIVWTERQGMRRIISMRKADKSERQIYFINLGRP